MTDRLFDRYRAIDTDTHITEPPDVWTARVSTQKWGDSVPHVKQVDGRDIWFIRDQLRFGILECFGLWLRLFRFRRRRWRLLLPQQFCDT